MSKDTLKLVLTDHWFEEIKSGRKTHEYRECKWFWINRICDTGYEKKEVYDFVNGNSDYVDYPSINHDYAGVEFQKAYRKNPERMLFLIKNIGIVNGKNTDLKIDKWVFDIELGDRIDE